MHASTLLGEWLNVPTFAYEKPVFCYWDLPYYDLLRGMCAQIFEAEESTFFTVSDLLIRASSPFQSRTFVVESQKHH